MKVGDVDEGHSVESEQNRAEYGALRDSAGELSRVGRNAASGLSRVGSSVANGLSGVGRGVADDNCLKSVGKIGTKERKSSVFDTEGSAEAVEEERVVDSIEGGGQIKE
nr:hypothetical protein BaRGS_011817 [Batillaria attramentaria]